MNAVYFHLFKNFFAKDIHLIQKERGLFKTYLLFLNILTQLLEAPVPTLSMLYCKTIRLLRYVAWIAKNLVL